MSERSYDAIVVGLGAHGSSTAYHLAQRGLRVLGIERFARGHTLGSSGGLSRIIRLSYAERPEYVPLLHRSWQLWRELEQESGESLLTQTGGVYFGPPESDLVPGALESAQKHRLAHEMLDARALRERFPVFEIDDDWIGLFDVQAGWLAPERCIETQLRHAERSGATLRFEEPAIRWDREGEGLAVKTAAGTYRADRLVLTAGAWMPELLPEPIGSQLWIERNVLFWFEPLERVAEFAALPIWIMDDVTRPNGFPSYRNFYGFPYQPGQGFKLAGLHFGDHVDPNTVDREPRAIDEERIRSFIRRRIPAANGERRLAKVCMYTNSPDGDFVIGRLDERVVYASACSGHGFKFASAMGELLAAMATENAPAPAFLDAARIA